PDLFMYASTIVNNQGIANAITKDYRMARYDPVANKLATVDIVIDGKKLEEPEYKDRTGWIPNWSLAADGTTAYLIRMSYPELYELDLSGALDKPIQGKMVGQMLTGHKFTDSRSSIAVGPDGKVYAAMAVPNDTKFGDAYELTHEVSYF